MQTTTVKLHSLRYADARTYLAAALFVAGNLALPQLCHAVHMAAPRGCRSISSRSSGPTSTAGASAADRPRVAAAELRPLRYAAAGDASRHRAQIPAAGRSRRLCRRTLPPRLAAAARGRRARLSGRRLAGRMGPHGSLLAAAQDFRIGLPGMLLQIFGGWAVIHLVIRR